MRKVCIEEIYYEQAPDVITSLELEKKFENSYKNWGFKPGFIESITGIHERRIWYSNPFIFDLSSETVKNLISKSGINKNEIGCIINCSVCLDYGEPTASIIIHNNLELKDTCINFDVSNACMGFTSAINIISNMIKLDQIKYGIVFASENSLNILNSTCERLNKKNATLKDFEMNLAALTLGSGSVAMLLCSEENSKYNHIINKTATLCDSKYWKLCIGELDRSNLQVEASKMMVSGINLLQKIKVYSENIIDNWSDESIDYYISHQISDPHTKILLQSTPITKDKLILTYPTLGNIGPASWPITLAVAEERYNLRNKHLGILSMGSGFNASCMSVSW